MSRGWLHGSTVAVASRRNCVCDPPRGELAAAHARVPIAERKPELKSGYLEKHAPARGPLGGFRVVR